MYIELEKLKIELNVEKDKGLEKEQILKQIKKLLKHQDDSNLKTVKKAVKLTESLNVSVINIKENCQIARLNCENIVKESVINRLKSIKSRNDSLRAKIMLPVLNMVRLRIDAKNKKLFLPEFKQYTTKNFESQALEELRIEKKNSTSLQGKLSAKKYDFSLPNKWFGFNVNSCLKTMINSVGETEDILTIGWNDFDDQAMFVRVKSCLRKICMLTKSKQYVKFCRLAIGENSEHTFENFVQCFLFGVEKTKENFLTEVLSFSSICHNKYALHVMNNFETYASCFSA